MSDERLIDGMKQLLAAGPIRVMIGPAEAVPWRRALDEHHVEADVIFLRDDGWTLGASKVLEAAAFSLWREHWIGFWRTTDYCPNMPTLAFHPIAEYVP